MGGSVRALEFMQKEIEESAASYHERYRSGQDIVVGVNKYVTDTVDDVDILKVDPEAEKRQLERLQEVQGEPRPGRRRREASSAPRGRRRRGQPPPPHPRGARRRRVDRRGLRRDARSLRRVQGRHVLLGRVPTVTENGLFQREGLWPLRAKARRMEIKAKRTLVKSAPELWELTDDLERLEAWMGGFVGSRAPVAVEVTRRVPERFLAWRIAPPADGARIGVTLTESGFGTAVEITAQAEGSSPGGTRSLEWLLDDLGSPDRRPFSAG